MRRFTAVSFLAALPHLRARFDREVPESMWAAKNFDGKPADLIAIVSCPCGEEPEVAQVATAVCKCGRAFILAGERVLVASGHLTEQADD